MPTFKELGLQGYETLQRYERAKLKSQTSLSLLNTGQSLIIAVAVTLAALTVLGLAVCKGKGDGAPRVTPAPVADAAVQAVAVDAAPIDGAPLGVIMT